MPDRSQEVVLCQHGLQFFPDKEAAVREMYRVLRPGGVIGLVVWAAEQPLGLYGPMSEAIAPVIAEPFPRAYDGHELSYLREKRKVL